MRLRRTRMNSTELPTEGDTWWPGAGAGAGVGVEPEYEEYDELAPDFDSEAQAQDDTVFVSATVPVDEELGEPWNPATVTGSNLARKVRILTGVVEPLLDRIPTERPRYTALACVMLCTATVSGISIFFALSEILGASSIWFVPFALFWSGFILSVDRWLVSASPNKHSLVRVQTLLLRLAVAVVLGFIIAEPLLLRVFQTAVVNQVDQDRTATTNYGIRMYTECNPLPGQSVPAGANCTDWSLNVSGANPAADQAQTTKLQTDISTLTAALATENTTLGQLATTVNDECNGVSGAGLTGHVGDGPACRADEQHYEDFKLSQPFAQQNSELSNDEAELATIRGRTTEDTTSMGGQITSQIKTWAAKQPNATTSIGLIERFKALIELSDNSIVVNFGAWLLRLFFVLIDCLPVLVKFIGGSTPYDELARKEVYIAQDMLQIEGRTRIDVAEIHRGIHLKREHAQAAKREQSFNADVRDHAAAIEAKQWETIDRDYELRLSRIGLTPDQKKAEPEAERQDVAGTSGATFTDFLANRLPPQRTAKANGHTPEAAFEH
jgi:hypothetical protein